MLRPFTTYNVNPDGSVTEQGGGGVVDVSSDPEVADFFGENRKWAQQQGYGRGSRGGTRSDRSAGSSRSDRSTRR